MIIRLVVFTPKTEDKDTSPLLREQYLNVSLLLYFNKHFLKFPGSMSPNCRSVVAYLLSVTHEHAVNKSWLCSWHSHDRTFRYSFRGLTEKFRRRHSGVVALSCCSAGPASHAAGLTFWWYYCLVNCPLETNNLRMYWTNLHQIFRIGKIGISTFVLCTGIPQGMGKSQHECTL